MNDEAPATRGVKTAADAETELPPLPAVNGAAEEERESPLTRPPAVEAGAAAEAPAADDAWS
jgi:hypothetical protein